MTQGIFDSKKDDADDDHQPMYGPNAKTVQDDKKKRQDRKTVLSLAKKMAKGDAKKNK